jgi:hypothetical protein
MIKAVSVVDLTPTTGEPGDPVVVDGTDFAASASISIGFGPEIDVTNELPTVTDNGQGSNPRIITGYTAKQPIKPGSFIWRINFEQTSPVEYSDNGDGTLDSNFGQAFTGTINYTTGYFTQTSTSFTNFEAQNPEIDYTTYEFDVTPSGLATDSSGMLSEEITVPEIWNGTEPVTVIDDHGNLASSDFTVTGSDVIPEPLTISAIILLSSVALVVSFYGLRKRPPSKSLA